MYDDPKNKLTQLEKVLYAKEDKVSNRNIRHELPKKVFDINTDWQHDETLFARSADTGEKKSSSLYWGFLIAAVVFCLIALGVFAFKFLGGGNVVSGNNIDIIIKTPVSVASGETVPLNVQIINNNNISLLGIDMQINFPSGVYKVTDPLTELKRSAEYLGDLLAGKDINKNTNIILFGKENEKKEIVVSIDYKMTGSNAIFTKTKTIDIVISSAPVSLVISNPTEINTNQSADFNLTITSNSQTVIKGVLLKAEYPFGFTYKSSNQKPVSGNDTWLVGDMAPGSVVNIKISGILQGQEGEERGFNFTVGGSGGQTYTLGTQFTTSHAAVTIRRPFVSADLTLGGVSDDQVVAFPGIPVEGAITWQNNLPYPVSDISITIKLRGNALDKSTVQVDGGFYRSIDNTIIFNKTVDPTLASLAPGETGTAKFTVGSFSTNSVTGAALSNPQIYLDLSVSGTRTDQGNNVSEVLFTDSKSIKIAAEASFAAKGLYYVGPFTNSGPIPPKAEKETKYTISWSIGADVNNITGVKVVSSLPSYVKWLGFVSPTNEKINYDSSTGQIVWNVGNILAGTGSASPAREIFFQVSLLPSVSQIGTTPVLINAATMSGKDSFTGIQVGGTSDSLSTDLSSDPYFKFDSGQVVP